MPICLCSPQQKHHEIERVEKWLKMVKNWNKYRNSEKVCFPLFSIHTRPPFFCCVIYSFLLTITYPSFSCLYKHLSLILII